MRKQLLNKIREHRALVLTMEAQNEVDISKLTDPIIKAMDVEQLERILLNLSSDVRHIYNDRMAMYKKVLRGRISEITRDMDYHENTIWSYTNGSPHDPKIMTEIYKALHSEIENIKVLINA